MWHDRNEDVTLNSTIVRKHTASNEVMLGISFCQKSLKTVTLINKDASDLTQEYT
jgi:hypothetical protein